MIIIVSIIYLFYLILIFLSRKVEVSAEISGWSRPFARIAAWLYQTAPFVSAQSGRVRENLNILNPAKNGSQLLEKYCVNKFRRLLLLFFAGNILVTFLVISEHNNREIQDGNYIIRNESGKGEKTIEATAYIVEEEISRSPVTITVSEQAYTDQEVADFFMQLSENLGDYILGENESLDEIRAPLMLQQSYMEIPITVSWLSSDYGLIDEDGSVYNEDLKSPQSVILTARLTYEDQREELEIPVVLCAKQYTLRQRLVHELKEQLRKSNEEGRQTDRAWLPEEIDGHEVYYVEKRGQTTQILWILLVIILFLLSSQEDQKLTQKVKDKERALMVEYPEFVSKLTLFVNAGMTVRSAIQRILDLYDRGRKTGERRNECYEELKITVYEMENGVYEEKAYENLGRRLRLPVYIKLGGLLSQNVRKGSKDLLLVLNKEAKNAFEERKSQARRLGEEAGTKLLLPMALMLSVVMILIIMPAFLSYQI